jgi:hypothetical protein
MCIAVIVVSLPTLKALIMRKTPDNTNRSASGYMHTPQLGSKTPRKSLSHLDTYRSHIGGGKEEGDDEIELVYQGASRKSSTSPMRAPSGTGTNDDKEVRVTTDVTVVRDVL